MKLTSLTVRNLMSYKDETTFKFDNLTYIVGPNGSGKSTIIDLLNIAFFRKAWRTNQLTNLLSNKDLPAYIKLTFKYGNDEYVIERHIGKSRKSSKQDALYKNGEIVISGNQNVTDEVKLLVGDQSLWITLVPQRQLTSILDNQAFKKFYTNAFKLENIDVFARAVNKLFNKFNHEISILDQQIDQYRQQLSSLKFDEKAYKHIKHNILTLDKQIEFLLSQDITSDRVQLERQLSELKQKLQNLLNLKHIQESTKQYLDILSKPLDESKLQSASLLLSKYSDDQIHNMFKINVAKWRDIINKLITLSTTYNNFRNFIQSESYFLKAYINLYKKYKDYSIDVLLQSDIRHLYDEYKPLALEIIAYLNKKFNFGLDVDVSCNILSDQHVQALKKIISLPDDTLEQSQVIPTIDSYEKKLLTSLKSWDNLFDKIRMFNKAVKQYKLSYLSIKADSLLSKLQNIPFASAINDFDNFDEYQHYKQVVLAIQDVSKYVPSLKEWKSLMSKDLDKDIDNIRKHIHTLDIQIQDLDQKHERIKQQISDLIQQKKNLQYQLTQMEAIKAKRDQLQSLIKSTTDKVQQIQQKKLKVEELQNLFDVFVKALNTKFRQTFPMIVKSVIERFSFNFDIVIDEEFRLLVKLDNDKIINPSMLSGAQQSILALAIRYAFARILDIRLPIILDEVTEGFDNSRIDMLKGFINQLSQYNQTIVISHDARIVSDNVGTIIQLPVNRVGAIC